LEGKRPDAAAGVKRAERKWGERSLLAQISFSARNLAEILAGRLADASLLV
jgi:hypothetical protein